MTDLPPFLLSRDRVLHGVGASELSKRVRAGLLVRVRHGVYVDGRTWRSLKPWEQYRVRVQAAAETFEKPTIFARHSAASAWGIPFIGLGHPACALTLTNDGEGRAPELAVTLLPARVCGWSRWTGSWSRTASGLSLTWPLSAPSRKP